MYCDIDIGDMALGQGHDILLGYEQHLFDVSKLKLSVKVKAQTQILAISTMSLIVEI